jgi:hypothetical protein
MRKRVTRKRSQINQNLDSFLDTLTNTVGVLMFVSLFISLMALKAGKQKEQATILTPLVSETNKKPRFFELSGNKVTYIDDESIDKQIEQFLGESSCQKPQEPASLKDLARYNDYTIAIREYQLCFTNQAQSLQTFRPKNSHYQANLIDVKAFAWEYKPIGNKQGETVDVLRQNNSEFSNVLAKLDPNKDYLAFLVRPNSFEAFRAARQQAWKEGFKVGWEPQNSKDPITFGSGSQGRSIGIQ